MLLVGLTGGIASGKTAVADRLAARGAVIVDADLLAREVVAVGTPGLAAVAERFGPTVLTVPRDGAPAELDRAALGAIVFADPDARRDLEAIVHPLVRARAAELTRAAPADAVVVQVIPLLVETGQAGVFDLVVVVDVDPGVQLSRLIERNGLTPEQAMARIEAQASRAQRLAVADRVVDNSGSIADLDAAVDALWRWLLARVPGPGETSGR
ncbi:dephospho-CoA kinase [Micropruina sonneratiae]|uniref:dephospho-CoA kinase n=1 Tax=Micropruina sonneratiae TaxID=2986940 RepID=UPI0022270086|nr:dephospho-CoA kinase [Micropruina sp. KQZ13P-5]MCW3157172.1 dephospho-CoA kinase [Micropruina sp. KQZ13P-5]